MYKLAVIDTYNALHRGYGANNTDNRGAVRSVFYKALAQLKKGATHICLVYDTPKGKNRRSDILAAAMNKIQNTGTTKQSAPTSGYKGRRGPKPDDFIINYNLSRELASVMGMHVYDAEYSEADDVLASFAAQYGKTMQIVLVTNDKDMYPCLNNCDIDNGIDRITAFSFTEMYGFDPDYWIDFVALRGKVDQVPGILGIGPSQALRLIQRYRSVDVLYDNLHKLYMCPGLQNWYNTFQLLHGNYTNVVLGKMLARLDTTQQLPDIRKLQIDTRKIDLGFKFMKDNRCIV